MLENLFWMMAGTFVGIFADRLWDPFWSVARRWLGTNLAEMRSAREARVVAKIPVLYASQNMVESLLLFRELPSPAIPILHSDAVSLAFDGANLSDGLIRINRSERQELPWRKSDVRSLRGGGAKVWDGDILYVDSVEFRDDVSGAGVVRITASAANYFSYISAAEAWRAQVLRRNGSWLLASPYRNLVQLLKSPPIPLVLSATTICTFATTDGVRIPLAVRSASVVNAMGQIGFIPTFGMEGNVLGNQHSRFDVVTYNFLKELSEELFGMDEFTHNADSAALDPDAIFEAPMPARLVEEFDSGRVSLEIIGICAELTDGALCLLMHATFSDPDFYRMCRRVAVSNWEWVELDSRRASLQFSSIDELVKEPKMLSRLAPTSKAALELFLRERNSGEMAK